MNANSKELIKLIQENPELPIVPMVDYEVVGDDCHCWIGSWGKAIIEEYWCGDERAYFKADDFDSLVEEIIDNRYEEEWKGKTDEEMERLAEEMVNGYDWVKCIAVRIGTPD
jgi:hypothetical protein